MRSNNKWIIIVLVALVLLFGISMVWGHSTENMAIENSDMEAIAPPDEPPMPQAPPQIMQSGQSDIEIVEPSDDPAFQIGFGMGPGLYGSGRHTSSMVGN